MFGRFGLALCAWLLPVVSAFQATSSYPGVTQLRDEIATIDEFLDCVRMVPTCRDQVRVFQSFSQSENAQLAIPTLLQLLESEAPRLDNNVCLTLEMILQYHPQNEIPIEALLEAIERKVWTSQQKCAQALSRVLTPQNSKPHRERLLRSLIPLTASQRSRVYEAALKCLYELTGQTLGNDPAKWEALYETETGTTLDLSSAFYELVIDVRPKDEGGYEVNGRQIPNDSSLRDYLDNVRLKTEAHQIDLAVVVRVSDEEITSNVSAGQRSLDEIPGIWGRMVRLLHVDMGLKSLTFAPSQDVIRPPHPILRERLGLSP